MSLETLQSKILIFSPDVDLAKNLSMVLEPYYNVTYETKLDTLERAIVEGGPALLLVDLFLLPDDVVRELEIIKRQRLLTPVIILRVYRKLSDEIEKAIHDITSFIIYKPFSVDFLTTTIRFLVN